MKSFEVTPIKNIGGKCEIQRDKDRKIKEPVVKIPNNKVIERGESVVVVSEWSPSRIQIEKAYREQLGKVIKGCLSTDFF